MTATRVVTADCAACRRPMAEVVGPLVIRVAGVTVEVRRFAVIHCPHCGHRNGWHGKPAVDVQDVPRSAAAESAAKALDTNG